MTTKRYKCDATGQMCPVCVGRARCDQYFEFNVPDRTPSESLHKGSSALYDGDMIGRRYEGDRG